MKPVRILILSLLLIGCGGGSNSGSNPGGGSSNPLPTPQVLQAGQWEFMFPLTGTPDVGYMEANLQVSSSGVSVGTISGVPAASGYSPYFSTATSPQNWDAVTGGGFPNGYILCGGPGSSGPDGQYLTGTITSNAFQGYMATQSVQYANLTATLPASGSNVTYLSGNWSYTGTAPDYSLWLCQNASDSSGTFTAQYISPLSGTYTGTVKTSQGGTDVITLTVTQTDLSVSATGTGSPATIGSISITGATVEGAVMWGTGTTSVNIFPIKIFAHIQPSGTSFDVVIYYAISGGSGNNAEWGTLTKN
jgi:hypothetical protein